MNEGGANWAGLLKACGQKEFQHANSCQFYYKRQTGKVRSQQLKFEIRKLATKSLLKTKSLALCNKAYGSLAKFINEKPANCWDERKDTLSHQRHG